MDENIKNNPPEAPAPEPVSYSRNNNSSSKFFDKFFSMFSKKTTAALVVVVLVIGVGAATIAVQNSTDTRQRADGLRAINPPCTIPTALNVGAGGYGDLTGDGKVSSSDSDWILQKDAGTRTLTPAQIEVADVNGTRTTLSSAADVNSIDSALILQFISGSISTFPVCSSPAATAAPTPTGGPTRFYLLSEGPPTPALSPAFDSGWEITSIATRLRTTTVKQRTFMITVPYNDNVHDEQDILFRQYISDPIQAVNIVNPTVKFVIRASQSYGGNRLKLALHVRVVDSSGALRGTIISPIVHGTTELGALASKRISYATTANISAQTGDRIVIEIGYWSDPPNTASHTGSISIGDNHQTDLPDSEGQTSPMNPWVELSSKINFVPPATPTPTTPPGVTTTPTLTPTITPTPTPAVTTTPTPTIPAGNTVFALTVGLDGLGTTGDNNTPNNSSGSNKNPNHPARNVKIEVFDGNNMPIANKSGTLIYQTGSGKFTGTIDMGNLASASYIVKIKSDGFLRRVIPGIQNVTLGQTFNVPTVNLVNGDINGDNAINILDYNILISCSTFSTDNHGACNANPQYAILSDLEDNGAVNQFDYNLFLRELSVQNGE